MSNFEYEINYTDEKRIHIEGYLNFVKNWKSEAETVNNETAIEEDHNLNMNNNNIEHAIVLELENYFGQHLNDTNTYEDEEENNAFDENEYEEFEEEKKKNIEIVFSDYLEYVFIVNLDFLHKLK